MILSSPLLSSQLVGLLAQPASQSPAKARLMETEVEEAELVTGSYSGFFPSRPPCCTMVGGSGVIKTGQVSSEMSWFSDRIMPENIF